MSTLLVIMADICWIPVMCYIFSVHCVPVYFVMVIMKIILLAYELVLAIYTTVRHSLDHILRAAELSKCKQQHKLFLYHLQCIISLPLLLLVPPHWYNDMQAGYLRDVGWWTKTVWFEKEAEIKFNGTKWLCGHK